MKRVAILLLLIALCAGISVAQDKAAAPQRLMTGVMPVYDSSGESFGEDFSRYLTLMVFQELYPSAKVEPVLLNPGGVYTPLEDEWTVDFGRKSNVDAVLVTNVQESDKPKNSNNWALKMEAFIVDLKDGKKSTPRMLIVPISKRDLEGGLDKGRQSYGYVKGADYAPMGTILGTAYRAGGRGALMLYSSGPSRVFEGQPLGKGARRLAQAASSFAQEQTASMTAGGPATPAPSGAASCGPINFRVRYASKNTSSKVFTILLNDREESQGVKDGVVSLKPPAGPLLLQVEVKDSPFRLAIQKAYQANTYLDCSQPERTLVMEIGGAGQAMLRWDK
jgi:hypothetical protein